MSTNADRLALAAQSAPPAEIIICHNSVLYWMKEAGLITQGKFDQLQQNTPAGGWDAVLANRSDTLVQHYPQGLANLPRGAVIGFIDPLMLQHSMVVVGHDNGATYIAGVNNLNVLTLSAAEKVGAKFAVVTDNQLKPLAQGMQVYWVDVDTLLARLP